MLSTALPSRYASCSVPCECLQGALLLMKAVRALRPTFHGSRSATRLDAHDHPANSLPKAARELRRRSGSGTA